MSEKSILNEIDQNREEYIEFFRKIIQADSINPPGNEKNVAIIIEDYLKEKGIKTEIFPFGDNRANLIAYLNDNFDGKNLLYNGHMDVVPPGSEEDWKNPPFSAFVKRNKFIFSRGAADMKGGLVAMVIALKILKSLKIEVSGNLILNAVADEETGGKLGAGWCIDNPLKSIKCDFAIIGEPSGFNPLPKAILLGEKGHLQVKITTNGISGHASMPALGKNAINMMTEIIEKLDRIDEYIPKIEPPIERDKLKKLIGVAFPSEEIRERIMKDQPVLQSLIQSLVKFSKALTMIKGGIKENVIPDSCEAVIDFRLLPGQKVDTILNALKKLIEEDLGYIVKNQIAGASKDVCVVLEIFNASEGSYWKQWEKSQDLKEFYNIVEAVYEKKPFYFLLPASADAHYLRNDGYCPQTILFGPGSMGTAHAIDEYIEIQDFINSIKVFTLYAHNFLSKK